VNPGKFALIGAAAQLGKLMHEICLLSINTNYTYL